LFLRHITAPSLIINPHHGTARAGLPHNRVWPPFSGSLPAILPFSPEAVSLPAPKAFTPWKQLAFRRYVYLSIAYLL
jgi:hypothetical protein